MIMKYDVPILFIIFKRYYTAIKVFERIKEVKPKKLYVAADGPRDLQEKEMCDKTRDIIKQVDWNCELHLMYRDENIGCKYGPYESISWFFNHEEEGVILEDDCVPDLTFFPFVREMLVKYRNDNRISMIAGHSEVSIPLSTSYVFSRFRACWGWATWKRAWCNIDIELENYDYRKEVVPLMVYDQRRGAHWLTALDLIDQNKVNAWDWPWYFSQATQSQLCIFPSKNLIANIGFGEDGTHCLGEPPAEAITSYSLDFPLVHPKTVIVNWQFEKEFEKGLTMGVILGDIPVRKKKNIFVSIVKELKRFIRRLRGKRKKS